MTPVTLCDVVEADLALFYAWHTDPVSVQAAAFRIKDPDIDTFRAR